MVRAENGSEFGSLSAAMAAECGVCGKPLRFKDTKDKEDQPALGLASARHCGRVYSIGQIGTFTMGVAPDPKYQEREKKIGEKMKEASEARSEGKASEGSKLEAEAHKLENEINAEDDKTDETETREGELTTQPQSTTRETGTTRRSTR